MVLHKIIIICFAFLAINVRGNQSIFFHKKLFKDCACFPNDRQRPRVSELASQHGRLERRVVYLFKHSDSGSVSVYVPNKEKQIKFPDLTVGDTDQYGFPGLYNLHELFQEPTILSSTIILPKPKNLCTKSTIPASKPEKPNQLDLNIEIKPEKPDVSNEHVLEHITKPINNVEALIPAQQQVPRPGSKHLNNREPKPTHSHGSKPESEPSQHPQQLQPTHSHSSKPESEPSQHPQQSQPTHSPDSKPETEPAQHPQQPQPTHSPDSKPETEPSQHPQQSQPTHSPDSKPESEPSQHPQQSQPTHSPDSKPETEPSQHPQQSQPTHSPDSKPETEPAQHPQQPQPTHSPDSKPETEPSQHPQQSQPTHSPDSKPESEPSQHPQQSQPTHSPDSKPETEPSQHPQQSQPTHSPDSKPKTEPSQHPQQSQPTHSPDSKPESEPSQHPQQSQPTHSPDSKPETEPSQHPQQSQPTHSPDSKPETEPSQHPQQSQPTHSPDSKPESEPSQYPQQSQPTHSPDSKPETQPSQHPQQSQPTHSPDSKPETEPSQHPQQSQPTHSPNTKPETEPSQHPQQSQPTHSPDSKPETQPSQLPQQSQPTHSPDSKPETEPSQHPQQSQPTHSPDSKPETEPSQHPQQSQPTHSPDSKPESQPSQLPQQSQPTHSPDSKPETQPSQHPQQSQPTHSPDSKPETEPSQHPQQSQPTHSPDSKPETEPSQHPQQSQQTHSPDSKPETQPSQHPQQSQPTHSPDSKPETEPSQHPQQSQPTHSPDTKPETEPSQHPQQSQQTHSPDSKPETQPSQHPQQSQPTHSPDSKPETEPSQHPQQSQPTHSDQHLPNSDTKPVRGVNDIIHFNLTTPDNVNYLPASDNQILNIINEENKPQNQDGGNILPHPEKHKPNKQYIIHVLHPTDHVSHIPATDNQIVNIINEENKPQNQDGGNNQSHPEKHKPNKQYIIHVLHPTDNVDHIPATDNQIVNIINEENKPQNQDGGNNQSHPEKHKPNKQYIIHVLHPTDNVSHIPATDNQIVNIINEENKPQNQDGGNNQSHPEKHKPNKQYIIHVLHPTDNVDHIPATDNQIVNIINEENKPQNQDGGNNQSHPEKHKPNKQYIIHVLHSTDNMDHIPATDNQIVNIINEENKPQNQDGGNNQSHPEKHKPNKQYIIHVLHPTDNVSHIPATDNQIVNIINEENKPQNQDGGNNQSHPEKHKPNKQYIIDGLIPSKEIDIDLTIPEHRPDIIQIIDSQKQIPNSVVPLKPIDKDKKVTYLIKPENPSEPQNDLNTIEHSNDGPSTSFLNIVQSIFNGKKNVSHTKQNIQRPIHPLFDIWLTEQLNIVNHDLLGLKLPDIVEIQKFKYLLINLITKNGFRFTDSGDLVDVNGRILRIRNLKLQRVMISDPAVYRQILTNHKCIIPHDIPYLEAIFVSLVYPSKILGVIPLRMTLLPKCKVECLGGQCDPNTGRFRPFDMKRTLKINWSPKSGEDNDLNEAELISSPELSRSHTEPISIDLEREGIEAAFKEYLNQRVTEGISDEANAGDNISNNHDDDDDGLDIKIVGGNAATSSGTPVNSRGRSGYDDDYWFFSDK